MEKHDLKVLPKEEEVPADKVMTSGRGALLSLVDLLDSTPNVPASRKDWFKVVRDIDQELVAGVVNARLTGNLTQPTPGSGGQAQPTVETVEDDSGNL